MPGLLKAKASVYSQLSRCVQSLDKLHRNCRESPVPQKFLPADPAVFPSPFALLHLK